MRPALAKLRLGIQTVAQWADRQTSTPARCVAVALAIGALPVLLCWLIHVPGHQFAAGIGLALFALGPAYAGSARRGLGLIMLTFFLHCAIVIFLTCMSPERTGAILPYAPGYWQEQITWIKTGVDKEYEWGNWLPAHFWIAGAASLLSFVSLGAATYIHGFFEVDLMNFYTGELILHSQNKLLALCIAWHIWSILRGIGFVFLIHETAALALEQIKGPIPGLRPHRKLRLGLAACFLLGDILCKATLTETCRSIMLDNLAT